MAIRTADDYIRLPDGSLKRNPASLPSPIINSIEKEQDIRETSDITPIILDRPDIAWQGLFKDYRNLVSETTEAADVFHYATLCQMLGPALGRRLHVWHAGRSYPNFYVCLVGRSGLTHKDTCWSRARDVLVGYMILRWTVRKVLHSE